MDNDEEIERKIKEAQKQKMKCRKCSWLNYDFFNSGILVLWTSRTATYRP